MQKIRTGEYQFRRLALVEVWDENTRDVPALKKWMLDQINENDVGSLYVNQIDIKVDRFHQYLKRNLQKNGRMLSRFKLKHAQWLSQTITITAEEQKDTYIPPTKSAKLMKRDHWSGFGKTQLINEVIPLTPEEALEFMLKNELTKKQYIAMQQLNKAQQADIFPPYTALMEVIMISKSSQIHTSIP